MKKFFTLLFLAGIAATPNVFADEEIPQTPPTPPTPTPTPTPTPIPIPFDPLDPEPGDVKERPRSLSAVSGWCANGTIQLYFSQDMGLVSVTVTNITTGNVWYSDAESSDGVIFIDIEPIAGCYTITIETQTSGTYYGEFML